MGGEGQLHGSALGRVCTVTFPQAHGAPRMILDAEYVRAVGWSFFVHLFAAIARGDLRLCHIKNDEVRWVRDNAALHGLLAESSIQHQTLHVVDPHPSFELCENILVKSHTSPDFSPELCCVEATRNENVEEEKPVVVQDVSEDNDVDDIALEDQNLPDVEVKDSASLAPAANLINSIRLFFDPKPAKATAVEDVEPKKANWWSASTQFFLKPFAAKAAAAEETLIPDMTYRHSEPPMRPMSASHRLQFPRMSYNTQPTEDDGATTRHSFHISSSWHHQADRMSASMNLPPSTKDKTVGSFVWI